MSTHLFPIPFIEPPALFAARARLEQACAAFDKADRWQSDTGQPIPLVVFHELRAAERNAASEEAAEIERRRNR